MQFPGQISPWMCN